MIQFHYGDESVPIHSFFEYPRDIDGFCAFCHGDPIAEYSDADTPIARFHRDNLWADTCPCCKGRPT